MHIHEPVHKTFVLIVLSSNEGSGEFVLRRRLARAFCCSYTHAPIHTVWGVDKDAKFRPLATLDALACAFIGYMR